MVLSILDPTRDIDARALARLDIEQIAWFGTIGRDGFPHAVPVWFLPIDERIVVLSEPATAKVRNVRENPRTFIHLEGGPGGEFLTLLQGTATVSERPAPAWIDELGSAYAAKYATGLAGLGLTMETMAAQYSCVIEFAPTKLIAW